MWNRQVRPCLDAAFRDGEETLMRFDYVAVTAFVPWVSRGLSCLARQRSIREAGEAGHD